MVRMMIISLIALAWTPSAQAQDSAQVRYRRGQELFRTNCSPCHGVHRERTGPMLANITTKRTDSWLRSFIRDSQKMILAGDGYAVHLFRQYNRTVMPSFEKLSDNEIGDILDYVSLESKDPREELPPEFVLSPETASAEVMRGQELFNEQCASCHFISREGYGPALGSVSKRLPREWLIDFIRNSQEMIKAGDVYATYVYEQFDQREMVPMEFLTEEDVDDILKYVEYVSTADPEVAGVNGKKFAPAGTRTVYSGNPVVEQHRHKPYLSMIFIAIAGVAAIIHAYLVITLFNYLRR